MYTVHSQVRRDLQKLLDQCDTIYCKRIIESLTPVSTNNETQRQADKKRRMIRKMKAQLQEETYKSMISIVYGIRGQTQTYDELSQLSKIKIVNLQIKNNKYYIDTGRIIRRVVIYQNLNNMEQAIAEKVLQAMSGPIFVKGVFEQLVTEAEQASKKCENWIDELYGKLPVEWLQRDFRELGLRLKES